MSAVSSEWFCLVVCLLLCSSEALENITAEPGQTVTLPCRVLNNKPITAVEWIRPELDPDYVLLYRDGRLDPFNQHPSYKNRVDLQDREMKDGDVSLTLKNVTKNDTGRYECRIFKEETNRRKRSSSVNDPICIINLEVLPPGGEAGGRKGGGDKDVGDKDGGDKDGIKDGVNKDVGDKGGGEKGGGHKVGIIVGSVVGVILLLAVMASVGVLIYRQMRQRSHLHVPPDEAADEQMF